MIALVPEDSKSWVTYIDIAFNCLKPIGYTCLLHMIWIRLDGTCCTSLHSQLPAGHASRTQMPSFQMKSSEYRISLQAWAHWKWPGGMVETQSWRFQIKFFGHLRNYKKPIWVNDMSGMEGTPGCNLVAKCHRRKPTIEAPPCLLSCGVASAGSNPFDHGLYHPQDYFPQHRILQHQPEGRPPK